MSIGGFLKSDGSVQLVETLSLDRLRFLWFRSLLVPRFLSGSGVKVPVCLCLCLVLGWVLVLLASAWVLGLAVACLRLGLCGTLFVGGLTKDFCDGNMFVLSFGPQKWDLREGPILHFGFVTFFVLCFRVSCTVLASSCHKSVSRCPEQEVFGEICD